MNWLGRTANLAVIIVAAVLLLRSDSRFQTWLDDQRSSYATRRVLDADWAALIGEGEAVHSSRAPGDTIIYFGDYQCPFCRDGNRALGRLARSDGRITVVYRHFPLEGIHPEARWAARASICSQEQDLFLDVHEALMTTDRLWEMADRVTALAALVGADSAEFARCLDSSRPDERLDRDVAWAKRLGIRGTPAFVGRGGVHFGLLTSQHMDEIRARPD